MTDRDEIARLTARVAELEALLGVPPGPATDDQFEAGVAAVRALKGRVADLEAVIELFADLIERGRRQA